MKRSDSELAFEKYLNFNLLDDSPPLLSSASNHHDQEQESVNDLAADDGDGETLFTSTTTPTHYQSPCNNINATAQLDSQSSICGCGTDMSPASASKPKSSGSGSSEQSDMEEAGPSEQSTIPLDLKRLRRKVSNRESARRSRRRKQAHLADLETQVEQMRGEHGCLYRRLGELSEEYQEADRCHEVLKSKVIALRAEVKLAQNMLAAAGTTTFSTSPSHLPNNITAQAQTQAHNNDLNLARVAPTITLHSSSAPYINMPSSTSTVPTQHNGIGAADAVSSMRLPHLDF